MYPGKAIQNERKAWQSERISMLFLWLGIVKQVFCINILPAEEAYQKLTFRFPEK